MMQQLIYRKEETEAIILGDFNTPISEINV